MSPISFATLVRACVAGVGVLALGPVMRGETVEQAQISGNNFEFPGFGPDHYKAWDIQGKQFSTTTAENAPVEIKDMQLHLYAGGPALALETIIQSPQATVLTGQSQAQGSDSLDIIGSNHTYEVLGYDWSWDGKTQVIRVGRNVHATFTSIATSSANLSATPSQPITIDSDTLEIDQEEPSQGQPGLNKFIYSGHVWVVDGECQTHCDSLEVRADRSATANPNAPAPVNNASAAPADLGVGRIEHIAATKNVEIAQGDFQARSDTAEFFPGNQSVVLSGSPQVRAVSSDVLLEGDRITWLRDVGEFDVEPIPDATNGPGRVRVTMPPLDSYQQGADHSATLSPGAPQMVITGESLHGQFGPAQRRFDIEKSVRVEDQSLNVDADHLDAEFDAPVPVASTTPNLLPGATAPQIGRLNHLKATGGVKIDQIERTTTTQQAEIFPSEGKIVLTGAPHVLDSLSHATIDGNRMELSTDGSKALVTSGTGQPAKLVLASLAGVSETMGANVPTTVVGDSLTMQRGDKDSNFTFVGQVHVTARDLEVTCGQLVANTSNAAPDDTAAANPLTVSGNLGEIQELTASNFVEITQRRAGATQSDYVAHAARAVIHPQAEVKEGSSDATGADVAPSRFVELFGDPTEVEGPARPEVELPPMQNLGIASTGTSSAPSSMADVPTTITSDQQWLTTSPAGSMYYFEGNVQIDGGSFQASCDKMQAEGSPPNNAGNPNPAGPVVLERVIAEGNVRITQGTRVSTAGKALLLPHEGKVELSENAVVVNHADGSQLENANLELSNGEVTAVSIPGVPGQPIVRPTIILPANTFDNERKPANKASAGTSL